MNCVCQSRWGGIVAVVAGTAAATIGTVNFCRTGCPLGTCGDCESPTSVVVPDVVLVVAPVTGEVEGSAEDAARIKKEKERLEDEARLNEAAKSGTLQTIR